VMSLENSTNDEEVINNTIGVVTPKNAMLSGESDNSPNK
jgi:hypothetical protein